MAFVAGVYTIDFTTILHAHKVNSKALETVEETVTSAITTLWLRCKWLAWVLFGRVIPFHVISSVREARVRGLE
jgi:ribulose-5-phosphate 4-epimerase/fuculose-1-phosphate aldolase